MANSSKSSVSVKSSKSTKTCATKQKKTEFNVTLVQDSNGDISVVRAQQVKVSGKAMFQRSNRRMLARSLKRAAKADRLHPV